jgi:hypothetical protein
MMEQEAIRNLGGLEIGALDASLGGEALSVISRGMRDNPLHIAAYGEDPERRKGEPTPVLRRGVCRDGPAGTHAGRAQRRRNHHGCDGDERTPT